jgi:hypothetical protein
MYVYNASIYMPVYHASIYLHVYTRIIYMHVYTDIRYMHICTRIRYIHIYTRIRYIHIYTRIIYIHVSTRIIYLHVSDTSIYIYVRIYRQAAEEVDEGLGVGGSTPESGRKAGGPMSRESARGVLSRPGEGAGSRSEGGGEEGGRLGGGPAVLRVHLDARGRAILFVSFLPASMSASGRGAPHAGLQAVVKHVVKLFVKLVVKLCKGGAARRYLCPHTAIYVSS